MFAVLLLTVQQTWAQDATVIDGISYVLNSEDKTAKVVKPDGASFYGGDIVIPDYVKYDNTDYAVTAIGESAFIEADLTSLQLPKETLKTIDAAAFREVYGLATIDIPETVTTIGNGAFQCYGLTYLHIPASVTDMGNSAIGGCPELETITVAEGQHALRCIRRCANGQGPDAPHRLSCPVGGQEIHRACYRDDHRL